MSKSQAEVLLDLVIDRAPKLRDAGLVLRELTFHNGGVITLKLDPVATAADEATSDDSKPDKPTKITAWNHPDLGLDDEEPPKRKDS